MGQNLISQTMTDAQKTTLLGDLTTFNTDWQPFTCNLSPTQIAGLSKMSPEDLALLELAKTYADQNAGEIPANVGVAEFAKDIALAKQIVQVDVKAQQSADMVRCSLIAVMSDGYGAAREIYRIAKARGRNPANAEFLDRFGARFARGPQPAKNPAP